MVAGSVSAECFVGNTSQWFGLMKYYIKINRRYWQASVFYIYRVFSNDRSVLPQYNTRLRLLYLL